MMIRELWKSCGREPSIGDLLSDSIALALMRADGIAPDDVIRIICSLNRHLDATRDKSRTDRPLARQIRARASHCRRLAAGALPFTVAEELSALAFEYDREAEEA